ncbi:Uncharacterised protein [Vibrio cholerae]|nr:Uncharacterised protein [Vibrio cholerae]
MLTVEPQVVLDGRAEPESGIALTPDSLANHEYHRRLPTASLGDHFQPTPEPITKHSAIQLHPN